MEKFAIPNYINGASVYSSSETQGLLVSLNGREKKLGEDKSRTRARATGVKVLWDQF